MAWVFNPFTGTFDWSGSGGGGGTPGGSSGQVQYNNGGSFGGMSGTSWDDTNRALTLTGATVTTSQPVLNLSQTWNAGAVTFTGLKFNAATGSSANSAAGSLLLDLQLEGTSAFRVRKDGFIFTADTAGAQFGTLFTTGWVSNTTALTSAMRFGWTSTDAKGTLDTILTRANTATLQLGAADVSSGAVAQTLQVQSNTGASTTGPNFTIKGSAGTTAGGSIIFQTAATTSYATALTLASSGAVTVGTSATNGTFNVIGTPSPTITIGNGTTANYIIFYGVDSTGPTIRFTSSGALAWSSSATNAGGTTDLFLFRDAADTLALRRSTNPQTFNIYNTYTDALNYERLSARWVGNVCYISTMAAGTGSGRTLSLNPGTGGALELGSNGSTGIWTVAQVGGHFLAGTDNAYDIGASGANRPRSIYAGTSIIAGGGGTIGFNSRAALNSPSDGVLLLYNWAGSDFGRLQFGGTTSSFPALKRSTTTLQARLADDTAFTNIQGKLTTDTAYTATPQVCTGYITIYDSTGTAYKVMVST